MKKLLLGFVFILFIQNTFSQITQWRGPNRDGHFSDSTLMQSWPENGPELILEVEKIGKGFSSAIMDGGIIYALISLAWLVFIIWGLGLLVASFLGNR